MLIWPIAHTGIGVRPMGLGGLHVSNINFRAKNQVIFGQNHLIFVQWKTNILRPRTKLQPPYAYAYKTIPLEYSDSLSWFCQEKEVRPSLLRFSRKRRERARCGSSSGCSQEQRRRKRSQNLIGGFHEEEDDEDQSYFERVCIVFTAPIVKFCINAVSIFFVSFVSVSFKKCQR